MKTITTTVLALALLGSSAFASGGRGTSFDHTRKTTCSIADVTPAIKSLPVSSQAASHKAVKFGPLNR